MYNFQIKALCAKLQFRGTLSYLLVMENQRRMLLLFNCDLDYNDKKAALLFEFINRSHLFSDFNTHSCVYNVDKYI